MSVDYDLIIIGATPAGIHAAIAAANLQARVALITQNLSPVSLPEAIHHYTLLDVARRVEQTQQLQSLPWWTSSSSANSVRWASLPLWADAVIANIKAARSPAVLAYQGVDVISGMGEFCRKPKPGFVVDQRFIRARAYLLTMDCCAALPPIAGLESVGCLTIQTLQLERLPSYRHLAILGNGKTAIELAQTLTRLGISVTLIAPGRLLPAAEPEAMRLVQAQLEIEGVQVVTQAVVEQVRSLNSSKQIHVNGQIIEANEMIVAMAQAPNLASLNLAAVGVEWNLKGVRCNPKLQTTNPHIYACEGRMGAECWTQVALLEATIALKNALFFPRLKMNPLTVPFAISTVPELAWIGLTEAQALEQYGKPVRVLRRSFPGLVKAQIGSDLTGFCKLVIHANGNILGAHLVGQQASELIGIFALALQQKLKIQAIADLSVPSPTLAEIIQQTAQDWSRVTEKDHRRQYDLLDRFFDWRRSWSR